MGISFLSPGLLWGLGAAAIPLLLHLLQRRRFQVVHWGAMEFLRMAAQQRSRRLKLEQILLLIIRTLVIALATLALARPSLRTGALAASGARDPIHAVLILDDSYSMGYLPPGAQSMFERARERALELIRGGLRRGDAVSVVLASDPARALIGQPSYDLPGAATRIRGLTLSDRGTNYGKAARVALAILEKSRFQQRQVFLFSDNQAVGWHGANQDPHAWEALSRRAQVVMVPTREGAAPNAAVRSVRVPRGLVTDRIPARIEAQIENPSDVPRSGLTATLEVDGHPQGSAERVNLQPRQTVPVAFHYQFDRAGVHACAVRISSDRLTADDAGYLAVRVRKNVRVLVVNGNPNAGEPEKDAAFFLQVALAPPAQPGEEPVPIEPMVVTDTTLTTKKLLDYDLVVLTDVAVLDSESRRQLGEFVQRGGGVLIFPGSKVDPTVYNQELLDAKPSLLPARFGKSRTGKWFLDPASFDHPALARFRGAQDVELNTAEFSQAFQLQPDPNDRAVHVMARFAGGDPALVEKQLGLGRLILAASSANTEWNNLPLKPAFVPLIQQMCAYLASVADDTRNVPLDGHVTKRLPLTEAASLVSVTGPHGDRTTLRPQVTPDGVLVSVEGLDHAGFYHLAVDSGKAEANNDIIAVNRDVAESDLRALTESELRRTLPATRMTWIPPAADLMASLRKSRQGIELWRYFLFAAMAMMLLESLVAQKIGRGGDVK